ncbi:hypothetical protein TNCV_4271421 [Trichonephila clavipes]|nr:hypothetical protein TNCV_4271421 [Trichonephila clavipes]
MHRRRIRAHYEQLSEFEIGRIIEMTEGGWVHIGESLAIWVEAMRPLEVADNNGWTVADFSVMKTYDLHTSVHHDHSQTADRTKITLVPTATLSANHACVCVNTVKPDHSGAWLDQVGIMLTGEEQFLAENTASNCVLTIIKDVSGDGQCSEPILLSILHATQALNKALLSRVQFLLKPALFGRH